MIYQEWKKILNAENALNSGNIIRKIKDKLKAKDPNVYKEWEEVNFDVNHQFQDIKNTLLHVATSNGNVDVVNALLGIKGIDVNAKDGNGYTPLHFAAKVGYTEVVNALLETKEIKVNVQDVIRGDTPLHLAAERGYEGIVKALLAKEASVDIKNHNGMTPLDLTTNKEIKALLQRQNTNNEDGSREQNDEGEEDSTVEPHKIKIGAADHGKLIEPQQTEEQTNTFLDSFFSMLIQPVSLVVLFFGGLISWLFLSNTGKTEGHIEQFHNPLVGPNDSDYNDQNDLHLF